MEDIKFISPLVFWNLLRCLGIYFFHLLWSVLKDYFDLKILSFHPWTIFLKIICKPHPISFTLDVSFWFPNCQRLYLRDRLIFFLNILKSLHFWCVHLKISSTLFQVHFYHYIWNTMCSMNNQVFFLTFILVIGIFYSLKLFFIL